MAEGSGVGGGGRTACRVLPTPNSDLLVNSLIMDFYDNFVFKFSQNFQSKVPF